MNASFPSALRGFGAGLLFAATACSGPASPPETASTEIPPPSFVRLVEHVHPGDAMRETKVQLGFETKNVLFAHSRVAPRVKRLSDDGTLALSELAERELLHPEAVAVLITHTAVDAEDLGSETHFGCTDATTEPDQVTCFSNTEATTNLVAPGAAITSTRKGGGASTFRGTSQAAALTSACAALLIETKPAATIAELEEALETSPTQVTDTKNGLTFPRLDCEAALATLAPTPKQPIVPALGLGGTLLLVLILAVTGTRTPSGGCPSRLGPPVGSRRARAQLA